MAGQKMLKFTNVERDMPEKRGPSERREDFNEIYAEFATRKAEEQASRCSQCCLLYTSPSPRDGLLSRMPSSA